MKGFILASLRKGGGGVAIFLDLISYTFHEFHCCQICGLYVSLTREEFGLK
jgi:hypothetical protein